MEHAGKFFREPNSAASFTDGSRVGQWQPGTRKTRFSQNAAFHLFSRISLHDRFSFGGKGIHLHCHWWKMGYECTVAADFVRFGSIHRLAWHLSESNHQLWPFRHFHVDQHNPDSAANSRDFSICQLWHDHNGNSLCVFHFGMGSCVALHITQAD